jgi:mannitol-1-phosphate/altronate dehydrogenase
MTFDYDDVKLKVQEMMREAEQRRLAHEAQAEENDPYRSLALNLEKISQQITERFSRRPQIPVVPSTVEGCCNPA